MVTTHAGQAFSDSVHLSPTGSFDCAALASGRRFDAGELLSDDPVLGLQREAGYIWGTLRDEDGELYSAMRRIAPPGAAQGSVLSLPGKLLVVSSGTPEGQLQLRREPRGAVVVAAGWLQYCPRVLRQAQDEDRSLWHRRR